MAHGQGRSRFALRAQPPGRRVDRARGGGQLGLVRRVLRPLCGRERPEQDHFWTYSQQWWRNAKIGGRKGTWHCNDFSGTRKKNETLSCARWLCLLYLRRCAARWLRPVGTSSHRVQNSGGSVGLGLAPRKVRAVCERGKGGGGLEASGSFRPASQGDKRMIGRLGPSFLDRWNERRKAVRTVQESRSQTLAFSN